MGRKSKSTVRRQEIMESCYQVVAKKGLEGATLKRIGKEMGVAPSLLMHYFASKEEMILALVDYMVEKMDRAYLRASKATLSAAERLAVYIDKNFDFEIPQSVEDKVFYGSFYLALSDERIRGSFRRMYDHDHRMIVALIKDYMEETGVKNLEPDLLAIQLISSIEGFYLYRVVHGDSPELNQAAKSYKDMLWRILRGGQDS
ncbi:MAG: TetR/AcrR family transcriptional regulator [Spirochaetaceae bacterium]|nr:MAG: TetR/AcrR family transcriptional regulator [Spirochaetaceae bacterium]